MIKLPQCPICNKTIAGEVAREAADFLPFCSERCRNVDLFRWSEGKYAIVEPLTGVPDEFDQPPDGEGHEADDSDG